MPTESGTRFVSAGRSVGDRYQQAKQAVRAHAQRLTHAEAQTAAHAGGGAHRARRGHSRTSPGCSGNSSPTSWSGGCWNTSGARKNMVKRKKALRKRLGKGTDDASSDSAEVTTRPGNPFKLRALQQPGRITLESMAEILESIPEHQGKSEFRTTEEALTACLDAHLHEFLTPEVRQKLGPRNITELECVSKVISRTFRGDIANALGIAFPRFRAIHRYCKSARRRPGANMDHRQPNDDPQQPRTQRHPPTGL